LMLLVNCGNRVLPRTIEYFVRPVRIPLERARPDNSKSARVNFCDGACPAIPCTEARQGFGIERRAHPNPCRAVGPSHPDADAACGPHAPEIRDSTAEDWRVGSRASPEETPFRTVIPPIPPVAGEPREPGAAERVRFRPSPSRRPYSSNPESASGSRGTPVRELIRQGTPESPRRTFGSFGFASYPRSRDQRVMVFEPEFTAPGSSSRVPPGAWPSSSSCS